MAFVVDASVEGVWLLADKESDLSEQAMASLRNELT
jgi:hypothetical protein